MTKVLLCLALLAAALPAAASDLLLILDASGSMWGQIEGEHKIVGARRVLGEVVDGLPEDAGEVGLVAYGHRREGDCSDIETVAPLARLDRDGLKQKIEALNPKGKTPITASVQQAFGLLEGREAGATVVLVSDGLETCGGDPCAAVRDAKARGVDFVMHVIGFDVAKEDVSSLECAAQAGGGLFLPAQNADALGEALGKAVEHSVEAIPEGRLSVEVSVNGKPHDASVLVRKLDNGEDMGGGRTYTRPETNPRVIPLPDGRFGVRVRALGLKGDTERNFEIAIRDGSQVEREFDFSTGTLSIGVSRDGKPSDAVYSVRVAGQREEVARGRTYTGPNHNPATLELTPGRYEVDLRSVEIKGDVRQTLGPVELAPQGEAQLAHEWASGVLRVGARSTAGELVDATLDVVNSESRSSGGGRTYTRSDSNPKEFILLPGDYTVRVQRIRGPRVELKLSVEAGETTEKMVEFDD